MLATLVAKLIAFLASKGLIVGGTIAPYVLMLTPAALMVGSGAVLYFANRASGVNLVLMGLFAVNEAIVAAQIGQAATPAK